ncbi:MAG: TonB-dependent receptor [Bacteroidales bacterium]|nr:TonB-dependent receptor [Bacteroidales bacterium]
MPEYGSKLTSPVYIRGVGSRINSPSIGLYVDRIPYFEKSAFAFDFNDVERVEILRGPQGTLYGRNTMGGIINVITRAPQNFREIKVLTDFGNYGFMKYYASVNQPLGSKAAVLMNGGYTQRNGFYDNQYHNESVGSDYTKNGSLKLRYNPVKPLVLTFKLGAERSYEKGYPYGIADSANNIKEINYNHKSRYFRDIVDNSLTASLYMKNIVITSVSAFQFLKDKQDIDQDFLPKDYYIVKQGVNQKLFSQEILLSANHSQNLEFTIGAFGFLQDINRDIDLTYGTQSNEVRLIPGNGYIKNNGENNSGIAAFGQTTVKNILGFMELTVGLRYDYEWNDLKYIHNNIINAKQVLKKDTLFQAGFGQFMPKLALRFNIAENTSVYLITSKGYRGGGFNTSYIRVEDETFNAESSWNYEAGIKSDIIKDVISVNAAMFYIDWNNQQVSQRVRDTVSGAVGNMYKNAGKTYSKGVEMEVLVNPFNGLKLGGNFGYTEAKYLDFRPSLLSEVNFKGKYLPFIPRSTYSAFGGYRHPLNSKFIKSVSINFSLQGNGKQYWNDENTRLQKSWSVVNGQISANTPWFEISLWSRNMLNKEYFTYMFYMDQFKNWYAQKGQPFTYGVSLSVNISGKMIKTL